MLNSSAALYRVLLLLLRFNQMPEAAAATKGGKGRVRVMFLYRGSCVRARCARAR